MRIRRVRTGGVGPLPAVDWSPGDCEVVYDDNQRGKTTLIDLLIDTVFSEGRKQLFENQDRYESFPDATVEMEEEGEVHTFTPGGSEVGLSELLGWNLPELHRLLCVRAGDVEIGGPREDADVWGALASVLEGLEEDYVDKLRRTIRQQTHLTSTYRWASNQRNDYFGDTVLEEIVPDLRRADEAEEKLSELLHRLDERRALRGEIDALRQETIPRQQEAIEEAENRLARLELRRAEEEVEEARRLQKQLREDFGRIDPDFEQPWEEARRERKSLKKKQARRRERRESRADERTERKRQRDALQEELEELGEELQEDEARLQRAEERLETHRQQTVRLQQRAEDLEHEWEEARTLPPGLAAGASLSGVLLILLGALTTPGIPSGVLYGVGGGLLLIGLVLGGVRYRQHASRRRREERAEQLLAQRRDDAPGEGPARQRLRTFVERSADELLREERRAVRERRKTLQEKRERRSSLETRLENREERLEELRAEEDDAEDLESRREELEETCETYREKTGLPDLETYRERLEERREREGTLRSLTSRLKGRLDLDDDEEDLAAIELLLERRREALEGGSPPDAPREELEERVEAEEKKLEELQNRLQEKEQRRDRLDEQLREPRKRLHELNVDPDNPGALFEKKRAWNRRLRDAVRDRLAGALLLEALDSLEEGYLQRVRSLLEDDGEDDGDDPGSLSRLYGSVMGEQSRVEFDPETLSFTVHVDGDALPERALSTGARTHLHVSCRLAALRRLFENRPGFVILDDPFLTYFPPRMRRAVDLLSPLLEEGWQVLFFTVDPAARDALTERCGATVRRIDDLAAAS